MLASADAATELMELGETEALGFFDEDDSGVGDIDADFDDRGGDENIIASFLEGFHDLLFLFGFLLAVKEADTEVGKDLILEPFAFGDGGFDVFEGERGLHERKDDESLATFADFLSDEGVDRGAGFFGTGDFGDNRFPILRHFVQDGDIEIAEESERERPRNRRGGHGEEMRD